MKILIIGTGGTIASKMTEVGYKSQLGVDEILEATGIDREGIDTIDLMNMDSTLIQPQDWVTMARAVYEHREDYDGIVITHGTDTLAYTSSMLSFMLRNIDLPVVLTGSMLPASEPNSDAPRNLRAAIRFAKEGVPGIFIAFMDKIMLGNRASKVHSHGLNAFQSINYPDVAYVKGEDVLYRISPEELKIGRGRPLLDTDINPDVAYMRLIPGLKPEFLKSVFESGCKGIVIEGYGVGGLPYRNRNVLSTVAEISRRIPVVMTTQAVYGGVDMSRYEVGRKALEAGVIPAGDMTKEATVTKLMWALGHANSVEDVRKIMTTNLAGELGDPGY
ncbi:MAG: asparaginase [Thermococci archaeon]|nr:asparaginase [Thermococci archaeon]